MDHSQQYREGIHQERTRLQALNEEVRMVGMSAASLELCRELYGLSGWGHDAFLDYSYEEGDIRRRVEGTVLSGIPAYDLGYLLRKLPYALEPVPGKYTSCSLVLYKRRSGWRAAYTCYSELSSSADTAEDAVAALAIELFKQSILKPQGV